MRVMKKCSMAMPMKVITTTTETCKDSVGQTRYRMPVAGFLFYMALILRFLIEI